MQCPFCPSVRLMALACSCLLSLVAVDGHSIHSESFMLVLSFLEVSIHSYRLHQGNALSPYWAHKCGEFQPFQLLLRSKHETCTSIFLWCKLKVVQPHSVLHYSYSVHPNLCQALYWHGVSQGYMWLPVFWLSCAFCRQEQSGGHSLNRLHIGDLTEKAGQTHGSFPPCFLSSQSLVSDQIPPPPPIVHHKYRFVNLIKNIEVRTYQIYHKGSVLQLVPPQGFRYATDIHEKLRIHTLYFAAVIYDTHSHTCMSTHTHTHTHTGSSSVVSSNMWLLVVICLHSYGSSTVELCYNDIVLCDTLSIVYPVVAINSF
jgi:hypothetical protein